MRFYQKKLLRHFVFYLVYFLLTSTFCLAQQESTPPPNTLPDRIVGDVGPAVFTSNLHIGSYGTQSAPLPYGFFDYERFAMRIDQLALKTIEIGYGYLELTGKVNTNNYKVKSTINGQTINKGNQVPLGIGTFQETPVGVFMLNAYHDFGPSNGNLLELNYFSEIETFKNVVVYPQVGIERQSSQYANYYYGINSTQGQQTGYPTYLSQASTNPFAGFLVEIPVIEDWYLNIYGKRKWLGSGTSSSPILTRSFQDTLFAALAYRFK